MNTNKKALALAAASLFLAGTAVASTAAADEGGKIKCEGVNSCKGQSACKSAAHSCKGQNACKGKGFLMLSPEACDKAKAEMAKGDEG